MSCYLIDGKIVINPGRSGLFAERYFPVLAEFKTICGDDCWTCREKTVVPECERARELLRIAQN